MAVIVVMLLLLALLIKPTVYLFVTLLKLTDIAWYPLLSWGRVG